jgi:hypothetical protein
MGGFTLIKCVCGQSHTYTVLAKINILLTKFVTSIQNNPHFVVLFSWTDFERPKPSLPL